MLDKVLERQDNHRRFLKFIDHAIQIRQRLDVAMTPEQALNPSRFGILLLCMAALQIALYVAWTRGLDSRAFYLDPRIGLFFLETIVVGYEPQGPGLLKWVAALWLIFLGFCLLRDRASLTWYLISEPILAVPSVAFFAMVVAARMNPSHGFSVAELTLPVPVFIMFTVLPFLLAWRLRKSPNGMLS